MLASGSADFDVRVWDFNTFAPVAVLLGHTGMVKRGHLMHFDCALFFFSFFFSFYFHFFYQIKIASVWFSPDDRILASASDSGVVRYDFVFFFFALLF